MARPILRLNMAHVTIPAPTEPEPKAPAPKATKAPRKAKPVEGPRPPWGIDFFAQVQWIGERPAVLCGPVRPLALGLGQALLERVEDSQHSYLRGCLRRYTGSLPYLDALLAEGAMRHDLNGLPVEPVSDEHRERARVQEEATPDWVKARRPQQPLTTEPREVTA
ncbi:ProQ/FINO family protein [Paracoccus sp. KR1-242]|uniref:ProQ/FINO family protein n=1 Tax=Paracoccus sp. KR1-242 TaxID=3410028 RepID=UPI003C085DE6